MLLAAPLVMNRVAPRVFEGARCLEVGAGSGSMALWMAARVGETGHVLATDINPRFVEALTSVRRAPDE